MSSHVGKGRWARIAQNSMLGLGSFVFLLSFLPGNCLILAAPIALWVTVTGVAGLTNNSGKKGAGAHRQTKSRSKGKTTFIGFWRVFWGAALWLVTISLIASKMSHNSNPTTELVAAMDYASNLYERGKLDEALAGFSNLAVPEVFQDLCARKYHNTGVIQLALGNPNEAKIALERAVSYAPKDIAAYYLLVRIAYERSDYSGAADYLKRARDNLGDGENLPEMFEPFLVVLKERTR